MRLKFSWCAHLNLYLLSFPLLLSLSGAAKWVSVSSLGVMEYFAYIKNYNWPSAKIKKVQRIVLGSAYGSLVLFLNDA